MERYGSFGWIAPPLAVFIALLGACREPTVATSTLAGEKVNGVPVAQAISDVPTLQAGVLYVDDARIADIRSAVQNLLDVQTPLLPNGAVGVIERACGATTTCAANADCADGRLCIDGGCRLEECAGWEPSSQIPECDRSFTCDVSNSTYCLILYWNRVAGGANTSTPVSTTPDHTSIPFGFLKSGDDANVGCAAVPIDFDWPDALLGPMPLMYVFKGSGPSVEHRTTLGPLDGTVCDVLGCPTNSPIHLAGLWTELTIVPEAPIEMKMSCSLNAAAQPNPLCNELIQELGAVGVVTAVLGGGCTDVDIGVRLDSLPLFLGLVPALPAPGGGEWTQELFVGAKNFHLDDMFSVVPVVAGTPKLHLGGLTSAADVSAYINALPDGPTWCSVVEENLKFLGNFGVDPLGDAMRERVMDALAAAHRSIEENITPLFSFAGPNLPANCSALACPNGENCCTNAQIRNWAAASLTYQKWDWFAGAFGPYPSQYGDGWLPILALTSKTPAHSECDTVATLALDSCDGRPTALLFEFEPDQDGDGVLTPSDPAPHCPSSDTFDNDGDGIPNGCDGCPNDPGSFGDWTGAGGDGDGVCTDVDNCPDVANSTQGNCNEVAESVHTPGDVRGDACDPVPCPSIKAQFASQKGKAESCSMLESLDIYPIEPGPWIGGPDLPEFPLGVEPEKLEHIATSAWFCQHDPANNVDCYGANAVDDYHLAASTCAPNYPGDEVCTGGNGQISESILTWYHRVTLENATSHTVPMSYFSDGLTGEQTLVWRWKEDRDRWVADQLIDGTKLSYHEELTGRLWLHADTDYGSTSNPLPSLHGNELANCHLDLKTVSCKPNSFFGDLDLAVCVIDPASCVALPWRPEIYSNPADFVTRFDASMPGEASYLVPTADGRGVGWATRDGRVELAPKLLGASMREGFASGAATWVPAAEPSLAMAPGVDVPELVALSATGALVDSAVRIEGTLLAEGDRGVEPMARGEGLPAVGATFVYSRSRRTVFALGGILPDGAGAGIWALHIDGKAWRRLAERPRSAGAVATATFDFRTGNLAWLERDHAALTWLELDVDHRTVHVRWQGNTAWDHHFLVPGVNGHPVLAASSEGQDAHLLIQVGEAKGGELVSTHSFVGAGALATAPLSDSEGIATLAVLSATREVEMQHARLVPAKYALPLDLEGLGGAAGNIPPEKL